MKNYKQTFKHSAVFIALSSALYQPLVAAEEAAPAAKDEGIEKIEVTATRRASTVQEIPVNITALDGDVLADQDIGELADVARWVPGLTVQDQGGRSGSPIIVRGLNTNSSGPGSDGGTVATYVGESPLNVDLKLLDIQRVEVLIGPQGTLYGAGTLGGAIRYIPNKPVLDEVTGKVYGGVNSVNEGGNGHEAGFVFNMPIQDDVLGFRAAFQQKKNAGYIDYAYAVKDAGTSLPDPDWSDASAVTANISPAEDVNSDETTTAKLMLRWMPMDELDALLSYTYQKQDVGGRSIVHFGTLAADNPLSNVIGEYESAYRVVEPREKTTDLLALEVTADLGFAELTSATSLASFEAVGQRDQTDLLIRLNYSYEEFPAFTAFTREVDEEESFVQEVRLVSQGDSDLTWIAGFYYSDTNVVGDSREFTPNFDTWAIDAWELDGNPRPDALEYLSISDTDLKETAIFGEVSYAVTEQLDITLGARFYDYEVSSVSKVEFPLFDAIFYGGSSTDINTDLSGVSAETAEDSGNLLKFNASYKFTSDVMAYVTLSEGFRIGGSNGIGECTQEQIDDDKQDVCALPNEVVYAADTTQNIELGLKSTWMKNRLHLNGALYKVDWNDPQIGGATQNGQQPITANGEGASASGFELSARAMVTDSLTAFGSLSYTKAELTADAPYLFGVFYDQGTELQDWKDGKNGDRLPGSPETQASLGLKYSMDVMSEYLLDINYGMTYQSDLITTVGMRNDGEKIDGYSLSNLSATLSSEDWSVTMYINNLFDEYAVTSARRNKGDIGLSRYDEYNQNRPDLSRNYGYYLATPMTIGVKFAYNFSML
jgi:outer membrane receptor protein involved in Fe transport